MDKENNINIRAYALDIITDVMENGVYIDKALHSVLDSGGIHDRRDRAFLSRLCEGTVERVISLDYITGCFSNIKVNKMKPVIRNILRMSVYQIFFMGHVPESAVCNEAVKLACTRGYKGLRGFVNAVLRNIIRGRESIKYPQREKGFIRYASVKYSMPAWIVERFTGVYGNNITEDILASYLNSDKKTTLRCNIFSKGKDTAAIQKMLEEDGASVQCGNLMDYALRISGYGRLSALRAFNEGLVQVQDESSMLTAAIAHIKENDTVIDLCAAPGGKTLHAADILNGTGRVISCDISESKTALIRENIKRTGFKNIEVYENNALDSRKEWEEMADVVIADLPCSGLGVIGKKCDIKYKLKPDSIKELAALQRKMLGVAVRYVKPGGMLVYSTCTITPEENTENLNWILKNLPLKSVMIEEDLPARLRGNTGGDGYIQVLPFTADTDGFFAALFTKKTE